MRGRLLWLFLALAALVMLIGIARASDPPKLPAGYSCSDVRKNVRLYGYWPALLWARANGFTEAQIREARKCLRE